MKQSQRLSAGKKMKGGNVKFDLALKEARAVKVGMLKDGGTHTKRYILYL